MSVSYVVQTGQQLNEKQFTHCTELVKKPWHKNYLMSPCFFKDHVYTETAAMHDIGDVFAADILYHDHCCKGYFNKYHAKIEEIMNNLEKEDSLTAGDDSFKARFLGIAAVSVYTWSLKSMATSSSFCAMAFSLILYSV